MMNAVIEVILGMSSPQKKEYVFPPKKDSEAEFCSGLLMFLKHLSLGPLNHIFGPFVLYTDRGFSSLLRFQAQLREYVLRLLEALKRVKILCGL